MYGSPMKIRWKIECATAGAILDTCTRRFGWILYGADASRAGGAPIATPKDWVRPDFYVSPPACKGFNTEFAGLVFKNDTRFKCDRGCSFDDDG